MESFTAAVQRAMASPTVKKLRALEQARVTRVSAKHAARREHVSRRLNGTLSRIDAAAKAELAEAAARRAADLQAQADDLEAQARETMDFAAAFESVETEDI